MGMSITGQKWVGTVSVLVLFTVAFLLRAVGADYGYFHGDERINEAAKVLTGQLVPEQHFYPPLINYLNAIGLAGLFGLGQVLDWWSGPSGFRAQYFEDATPFYVTARLLTAATGALLAPLFYGIARHSGLARDRAFAVGLVGALFPLGVFMSNIAKGDVALATALIATIWATLVRFDTPRPGRWDVIVALMAVLTVSFKQSGVLILAPLALGYWLLIARSEGGRACATSVGRILLTAAIAWPILNIGLVLDFASFLEFQKIQAVMSVTGDADRTVGLVTLLDRLATPVLGLNPVWLVAALLAPLALLLPGVRLDHKPMLIVVWIALVLATVGTALLVGSRQPEHLWIANFAGLALLAALALAGLSAAPQPVLRFGATAALAVGLVLSASNAAIPLRQANAPAIREEVDTRIARDYADERIITMLETNLPKRMEAQAMEHARWDRLAAKYDVVMPELSEERLVRENVPGAVFYIGMPTVMYGLEGVDEDAEDYVVQAHAWPPQREEWQLDYWLDQGFSVFVVKNLPYMRDEVPSDLMRGFFADMEARCVLDAEFSARKPLYLERDVSIFRCPQHGTVAES